MTLYDKFAATQKAKVPYHLVVTNHGSIPMRSIVFLDLDNTLWSFDGTPPSAMRAIRAAQANGHLVLANTGRTRFELDDLSYLGLDGICCAAGSDITLHGEQILLEPLGADRAREILRSLDIGVGVIIAEGSRACFLQSHDEEILARLQQRATGRMAAVAHSEDILSMSDEDYAQVHKFSLMIPLGTQDEMLGLIDLPEGCAVAPFFFALEVTSDRHTKASAMEVVRDRMGGSWRTVAIGDSSNDIEMLHAADVGIAMGNGTDEAKAASDFVTDTIYEDGLLHAFERLGLV